MNNLIVQTKFALPQTPGNYLPRPRLDALWQQWVDKRLVLITAGAGFGKTSFIAANAQTLNRPCAWYALDELDREIESFAAHLLQTVIQATNPKSAGAHPNVSIDPHQTIAEVVRALRGSPSGCLIVLDDVHLIANSTPVIEYLTRLIKFLPENVTLILSSREHLDIATMRLRTQGILAALDGSDLNFSADELKRFIDHRFPETKFSPKHLRRIANLTEGWAAGLEIFCQVLEGKSPVRIEEALAEIRSAGAGWFGYFAEEVLGNLDTQTRRFLLRSSVLPRLDSDLCDQILGGRNSAKILEELSRRNLFTFTVADGSYRYHHLFQDFLRKKLAKTSSNTQLIKLHRSAARALESKHNWVEAITAHADAGNTKAILRLLDKLGHELLHTGQYTILNRVLSSIPARIVNGSVPALYVLGRIHVIQGRWDEAERVYRRAIRLSKRGPRRVELLSLLAHQLIRQGRYRTGLKLCKQALDEPGRKDQRIRARILGLQGVASADLGRIDESEAFLKQALAIFHRKKDSANEAWILYLLAANVYMPRGDFQQATIFARRSVVICRKLKDPRRICHSLGILGWVIIVSGNLREGRDITEESLRLAENIEYQTMIACCRYQIGLVNLYNGDFADAHDYFDGIRELSVQLGEAELQSIPYTGMSAAALASGNRHAGRKYAKRALEIVKETKDIRTEAECYLLLGRVAVTTNKRKAEEYWDKADRLFRRFGATFDRNRLRLYRLDTSQQSEATRRKILGELLQDVAENRHEHLFTVFEPMAAARILTEALSRGIEIEYVTDLLIQLGEECVDELISTIDSIPESAPNKPDLRLLVVKILARIGGEKAREALTELADNGSASSESSQRATEELSQVPSVPLHICALGPLTISVGRLKIDRRTWRSKRALRLFHLLLVHRFKWVPQELVLESLWPGSEPAKAMNNLRQSVFLLRKALEPDRKELRHSLYIQQSNEAYRLEAGAGFTYDVIAFEEALGESDKSLNAGHRKEAGERLQVAVDLYRGDFLSESPYEELATFEREHLRHELLRGLLRLIDLHAQAKRWESLVQLCRHGLTLDPYNEKLSYHLVNAQYRLGNRREALTDFHRYEEMMMRELDLLPSTEMQTLADKVLALGQP